MSDFEEELDELDQYTNRFIDFFPSRNEECGVRTVLDLFRHHRNLNIQTVLPWRSAKSAKDHCFVLFSTPQEAQAATQIDFTSYKMVRISGTYLRRLAYAMDSGTWNMLRSDSYGPPQYRPGKRPISEVDGPSSSNRPTVKLNYQPPVGSVVISNSEYTQLKNLAVETSSLRPQLANSQSQLVDFQLQLENLKSQFANSQFQLGNFQSQYANSQSLLAGTQSQLANSQSQITQLRTQLALAADQWNKLKARLHVAESQLNRPMESRATMTEPRQEGPPPTAVGVAISIVDTAQAEELDSLRQALREETARRETVEAALSAKREELSAYQAVSASLRSIVAAAKKTRRGANTHVDESIIRR